MAGVAAIIKEVAEQLVLYFNRRRLEVGWDGSIHRSTNGRLLPKQNVMDTRCYKNIENYPELRQLLCILETEGIEVKDSKTEAFIKSALEECICEMNTMTYRDIQRSLERGIREPLANANAKMKRKLNSETLPPVTVPETANRRTSNPFINRSSAERIVSHASKMISNLLRLTKEAYLQQDGLANLQSKVINTSRARNSPRGVQERRGSEVRPLLQKTLCAYDMPQPSNKERTQGDSPKGDHENLNYVCSGTKHGCSLFTRISTDTPSQLSAGLNLIDSVVDPGRDVPTHNASAVTNTISHDSQVIGTNLFDKRHGSLSPVKNGRISSQPQRDLKKNIRNIAPTYTTSNFNQTPLSQCNSSSRATPHGFARIDSLPNESTKKFSSVFPVSRSVSCYGVKTSKTARPPDLPNQVRMYGSPKFLNKLACEIKRVDTLSERSRVYWSSQNNRSASATANSKRTSVSKAKNGQLKKNSGKSFEQEINENNDATSSNANHSTGHRMHKSRCLPVHSSNQLSGTPNSDLSDSTRSKKLLAPAPPNLHKFQLPSIERRTSEQLQHIAMITANALTQALGIPAEELKAKLVAHFREAVKGSIRTNRRKTTSVIEHVMKEDNVSAIISIPSVKMDEEETVTQSENLVYRVRVESVRYLRSEHPVPGTSTRDLPIPPISITLRGTKASSPSLKLFSAEVARLGDVGGHPVILRDYGAQEGRVKEQKHNIQSKRDDLYTSVNLTEGSSQVDHFAIVCPTLGKLVGVHIRPIISKFRNGNYEWFIKDISVVDLENHKKYMFRCQQWLGTEKKVIRCERVKVESENRTQSAVPTINTENLELAPIEDVVSLEHEQTNPAVTSGVVTVVSKAQDLLLSDLHSLSELSSSRREAFKPAALKFDRRLLHPIDTWASKVKYKEAKVDVTICSGLVLGEIAICTALWSIGSWLEYSTGEQERSSPTWEDADVRSFPTMEEINSLYVGQNSIKKQVVVLESDNNPFQPLPLQSWVFFASSICTWLNLVPTVPDISVLEQTPCYSAHNLQPRMTRLAGSISVPSDGMRECTDRRIFMPESIPSLVADGVLADDYRSGHGTREVEEYVYKWEYSGGRDMFGESSTINSRRQSEESSDSINFLDGQTVIRLVEMRQDTQPVVDKAVPYLTENAMAARLREIAQWDTAHMMGTNDTNPNNAEHIAPDEILPKIRLISDEHISRLDVKQYTSDFLDDATIIRIDKFSEDVVPEPQSACSAHSLLTEWELCDEESSIVQTDQKNTFSTRYSRQMPTCMRMACHLDYGVIPRQQL